MADAKAPPPPPDYDKMSVEELQALLHKETEQLGELKTELKKSFYDEDEVTQYAEDLIEKMFTTWAKAGDWIKDVHKTGRARAVVFGPTGQPRHLWAYLHSASTVRNAMDRRGPNSIIQGHSSGIGYTASYEIAHEYWHTFASKGIDLGFQLINMVHDSAPHECNFVAAPIGIYLIEHGMTTLVAEHYERVYGMKTTINHIIDLQMGVNEADLLEWSDMRFDSLANNLMQIGKENEFSKKTIRQALHNVEAIAEVRLKELKKNAFDMTLRRKTDWYLKNCLGIKQVKEAA